MQLFGKLSKILFINNYPKTSKTKKFANNFKH